MHTKSPSDPADNPSILEVVTFILSIYVLIALFVEATFPLGPEVITFLNHIDFYVCMIFLADFFIGLHKAPSKRAFLKWGWIDFISSIPMLGPFRFGRIIRVFRILRALRSVRKILSYLFQNRRTNSLASIATISFMLLVLGSIAMLQFETSADANIRTPGDAFWWAYTTITTVGYGDKYPISTEGRIVAALIMTLGVGVFGTFAGFVASLFVEPEIKQEETEIQQLTLAIQTLSSQVEALEAKVNSIICNI